jgi:hypothetical protein
MNKSIIKRNILKEAGSLLIAAMLVLTAIFVFATMTKVAKAEPTVIFSEGFENWVPPSTFPPVGWGIYNENTGNTWIQSTTGQRTGVACAKCTYDSVAQNDDWLTTKGTVVAPGGEFSLWIDTYSYGDDEYEIYMSTTGNTPADFLAGTLLAGVYYPVPTTYTQYNFGMSAYEGMTVWFGIRYTGNYAWYIWVDDVTLPDGSFEGFEGTAGTPGHWPGWSQYVVSGTDPDNKWDGVQTGTSPTCSPNGGSWMARYDSYYITPGNIAELIHDAPFDFSITGDVFTLNFWMYHDIAYSGSDDRVSICASHDASTWDIFGTFNRYDGTTGWATHSVDLSAFAGLPAVYIGFYAESGYGHNMYIDDVKITCEEPGFAHDVGVTGIISPTSGPFQSYPVEVTVENFGTYPETDVPVNVVIEKEGVPEYNATVVINIDAGESKNVVLSTWMPADFGQYNLTACTILDNDSYAINDFISEAINLLDAAPNVPNHPVGPNGYICISYEYATSTTDPDGDNVRYGWDWDDGSPIEWSGWYSSGAVCYMSHSWNDPGTYYVKVKAKHNWSSESDWSTQEDVVILNHQPNIPSSPNPTDDTSNVDINAVMSWDGGDLDLCDTVTYNVYFGTSSPPPLVENSYSTMTYDPPGAMSYSQKYYWKITAVDNHYQFKIGPIWDFTTQENPNSPPNQPNTPTPANNTNDVNLSTSCLSWVGGGDPDGDPVTYDVYFSAGSPPSALVATGLIDTQWCPQGGLGLDPSTPYYWRVVAYDNHGSSTNGPIWFFNHTNHPPNTPSSPNPVNHTTGISVNAVLSWSSGDPDPGDTVTYDVYFGTAPNAMKVVSTRQTNTSYDPPGTMNYSTSYYWQIVAWDNHNTVAYNSTWHFNTHVNNPPNKPDLPINPNNNTGNVSVVNTVLTWRWIGFPSIPSPDPNQGDTVTYDVYWGFAPDALYKLYANYPGFSYALPTMDYNTHYYWKIVAWDNHGASSAGPIWNFYTHSNSAPYQPSNPTPAYGVSNVCTCDNYLSWKWYGYPQNPNKDPNQGDTVTYDVYFGATYNPPLVANHISATTWSPPEGLKMGTIYYWHVVAYDNHGFSTNGPGWAFQTSFPFSVKVATTENNKRIQVNITNKVNQPINNAKVWMNFTDLVSPVPCASPYLNTNSTQFTQTPPGSGKWYWTGNIPVAGKTLSVKIDGGCANFDVNVTVSSCSAPNPSHRAITKVTKHGYICDLTLC